MKKNNIDVYEGLGSFKDATHVNIAKNDGSTETIEGKNIIIATGSKPSNLPFIELDKERIITSTEALKLKEVPKHMIVIGGGVIGLAIAVELKLRGAEVTVISRSNSKEQDAMASGATGILVSTDRKAMKNAE